MNALRIGGLGQISNVGLTVESSCAAHRAGIVRVSPVEHMTAYDPDEMEVPIVGAAVGGLTDGFFQMARWVVLGERALLDLSRYASVPLDHTSWERSALLWVVPTVDFERFRIPEDVADVVLKACCTDVLLPLSRSRTPQDLVELIPSGPIGTALACVRARALLATGRLSRVVILATDSLLDPLSLMQLVENRRLKTADHPVGLTPGESGACILLEPGSAPGLAKMIVGVSAPENDLVPDESDLTAWRTTSAPAMGAALATAIQTAFGEAGVPLPFRGDLVLDLNGEPWRALAWGHAQSRLTEMIDFTSCRVVLPAMSFGEIGSVAPVAGLCLAVRAFERKYASGQHALVASLSDGGRAAAIVVGASA